MDLFLYDNGLHRERLKSPFTNPFFAIVLILHCSRACKCPLDSYFFFCNESCAYFKAFLLIICASKSIFDSS